MLGDAFPDEFGKIEYATYLIKLKTPAWARTAKERNRFKRAACRFLVQDRCRLVGPHYIESYGV